MLMDAQKPPLRYLSICSGIEAATAAWHPLGWQAAGFSEIDNFARAILMHHYPQVPLHGDFTALTEKDYGAIDLLVGGTPCQSFSIAGLRKGLDDDRGNLALEFIRLAARARPRWVVWENVPGVLSIDGGRAFGSFLGGLAECGYGFAYRILDAQYFGVPQRRRRVFVIGYFGNWRPAAAVLFERESLRGDITPRREARKSVAGVLTSRASGGGGGPGAGTDEAAAGYLQVAGTLKGGSGDRGWSDPSDGNGGGLIAHAYDTRSGMAPNGSMRGDTISPTLRAKEAEPPFVTHSLRGEGFDASEDGTGRGVPLLAFGGGNTSGSIDVAAGLNAKSTQRQDFDTETLIAFSSKDYGNGAAADIAPTLRAMNHAGSHANAGGQLAVAFAQNQLGEVRTGDVANTINTNSNASGRNTPMALQSTAVRRLTPRECERLQGFKDDYTLIPHRGKMSADGPRYKVLGNSMAVPVMRWLGERIKKIDGMIS